MKKFKKTIWKKYPDDERVKRLVKNFNPKKISETLPTSEYTAPVKTKVQSCLLFKQTKRKQ